MNDRIEIPRGRIERKVPNGATDPIDDRIRYLERRCEWIEEHQRKNHRQVTINQIAITFWLVILMLSIFFMV